jgi:hypothetical protein
MAAPTYATDLTDILLDMASTTGWTALGGGASGLVAPETDFYIQGSNCISKAGWSSATRGMIYNAGAQTIASGEAVFMWLYYWAPNSLDTEAGGGLQVLIGSGTGAYKQFYVGGSDTLTYGGWLCAVVDPTLTADATTGSPTSTTSYFGALADVPSGGPSKGQPLGIDAFRHGRELQITNGDLANGYATFDGAASFDNNSTRRWGLLLKNNGAYYQQGLFLMGTASTAVDFRDSNRTIFIQNTKKVSSTFNAFEIRNASSRVDWTNIQIQALGTTSRGNFITTDNATVNITNCTFTDLGTFNFKSNAVVDGTTFRNCGLVTLDSTALTNCKVFGTNDSTKAISTNTLSTLTDNTFTSSGTKHAIELTSLGSGTMTWENYLSGYAVSDGSTGNEAIYVNVASGNLTINVSSGYNTPSIRTAGATVTVSSGAVTVRVKAVTSTGTPIQSARVLLKASDNTGPFPYQETVTITRSVATATVSHTGHGLETNDYVAIDGADQPEYNGVKLITRIDANSYSYSVSGSPATPATGTITSTFVALYGTTDANGLLSTTRVYGTDQPVNGWTRKSTSSPYYKEGTLTGTITAGVGYDSTTVMVSDE